MRNLRDTVYYDIDKTEQENKKFFEQVKRDRIANSIIFNSLFFGSWIVLIGLALIKG